MNTPTPQPPAVTKRPNWRAAKILCAAFFGMLGLAWAAAIPLLTTAEYLFVQEFVLFFATILGLVAGILHAPFVCIILRRAELKRALPFVYGLAIIPTVVSAIVAGPISAIVAIVTVLGLSAVAAHRYRLIVPGTCDKCGYLLQGLSQPGCPECGWGRGA